MITEPFNMVAKIFPVLCVLALMTTPNIVMSLQKCSCDISTQTWDCSFRGKSIIRPGEECFMRNWLLQHNKLVTIPTTSFMDVIDVSYNKLGFNETAFISINRVGYLDLSSNYLKSLELLSQSEIQTLVANDNAISTTEIPGTVYVRQEIILARNKITTIPPNTFPTSLRYLDLSGNPLSIVSKEAFKWMSLLEILHLNNTQQLSELENGTFDGLVSLKLLSLNDNKLTHLPEDLFSSLRSLETIFLESNTLTELPLGIFRNQYYLRVLNLDFNQLTELPAELFSRLHSLEYLSVRSNLLKTLPDLRLCSGPISTVVFRDNLIERLDEGAVRALLRNGFVYGDVSNNLIDDSSLSWIEDDRDIVLNHLYTGCRTIRMSAAISHGYISYCQQDSFATIPSKYSGDFYTARNHEE